MAQKEIAVVEGKADVDAISDALDDLEGIRRLLYALAECDKSGFHAPMAAPLTFLGDQIEATSRRIGGAARIADAAQGDVVRTFPHAAAS
ncbi:MAG: hypothetical protein DI607_10530 [Sphingomonas hengshuiensis]|nr:MAG: hypothetical protein DI607_10530 [Sphingomonas hengshuiensis]